MRTRIVMLAVVSAAVAIVLFGLPLAVAGALYAQQYKILDLERQAERAAVRVSAALAEGDDPSPDDLDDVGELTFRSVYDADGNLLLGRGPEGGDQFVERATRGRVSTGSSNGELIAAVPVFDHGDVVGVSRVSGSQSTLLWPVGFAWIGMIGLAGLALGAVWLLARRQASRMAQPLDQLTTAAQRLGNGDFSVRLPPVEYAEIDAVGSSLNRTAARLDDLLARERAFSAEASHQLRTPLTSLRLGLESALERPGEDARPALFQGLRSTERIERTVEELLTLARDTHTAVDAIDVGALLAETRGLWSAQFEKQNRPLIVVVEPQTPLALASGAAVRQVLAVLLENALVHGTGPVQVTARDAGDAVGIEVADRGPGITLTDAELFTRRSSSATGHGLGLALARRLAEAEGGHLRLARPAPPQFALLLRAATVH
ncbi:ATP-binding protein [Pseudonocardia saturnea]